MSDAESRDKDQTKTERPLVREEETFAAKIIDGVLYRVDRDAFNRKEYYRELGEVDIETLNKDARRSMADE